VHSLQGYQAHGRGSFTDQHIESRRLQDKVLGIGANSSSHIDNERASQKQSMKSKEDNMNQLTVHRMKDEQRDKRNQNAARSAVGNGLQK